MHPTYDPSKLTDEELLNKLIKLYNMHGTEINAGHDAMVSNIATMINTLEFEKETRTVASIAAELKRKGINLDETIEIGTIQSNIPKKE